MIDKDHVLHGKEIKYPEEKDVQEDNSDNSNSLDTDFNVMKHSTDNIPDNSH